MSELTAGRLAAIKARAAMATPPPWYPYNANDEYCMNFIGVSTELIEKYDYATRHCQHIIAGTLILEPCYVNIEDCRWGENAEFIAHARQDVPDLIAEVERLRQIRQDAAGQPIKDDIIADRDDTIYHLGRDVERLQKENAELRQTISHGTDITHRHVSNRGETINLGRCACGGYHVSDTECLIEMCEHMRQLVMRVASLEVHLAALEQHMSHDITVHAAEPDYAYRNSLTSPTGNSIIQNGLTYPEDSTSGHILKEL